MQVLVKLGFVGVMDFTLGSPPNYHVIARRAKPDVAIPSGFRKLEGIATPVCELARNDVRDF